MGGLIRQRLLTHKAQPVAAQTLQSLRLALCLLRRLILGRLSRLPPLRLLRLSKSRGLIGGRLVRRRSRDGVIALLLGVRVPASPRYEKPTCYPVGASHPAGVRYHWALAATLGAAALGTAGAALDLVKDVHSVRPIAFRAILHLGGSAVP